MSPAIETKSVPHTKLLAAPWHTAVVILALTANSFSGWHRSAAVRNGAIFPRPTAYLRTIAAEWLLLAFVLLGLWLRKSQFHFVLGPRWTTFRALGRDCGIAMAFLILSVFVTSAFGSHNNQTGTDPAVRFLMPQGAAENCLWILVALSAGICEEAIYRGYLQGQFIAMTRNVPAGVVLSAALFAASHAYQGLRNVLIIGVGALMSGAIAFWRRSVRPGMIAHTLQDLLAIVVPH